MRTRSLWVFFVLVLVIVGCKKKEEQVLYQQKTIAAWMKDYKDLDSAVRDSALAAFRKLGPKAKRAIPILTETLNSKDSKDNNILVNVAWTHWVVSSKADTAVPVLIAALPDKDWKVRKLAVETLGKIGSKAVNAAPILESLRLNDKNKDVRDAATEALKKTGLYQQRKVSDQDSK